MLIVIRINRSFIWSLILDRLLQIYQMSLNLDFRTQSSSLEKIVSQITCPWISSSDYVCLFLFFISGMTLLLLLLNLNYGLERNALNRKFGDGFYPLMINTISNKKLDYMIKVILTWLLCSKIRFDYQDTNFPLDSFG